MYNLTFSHGWLFILLALALILCAFCAASETGLMSLNRYRLRHLAKTNPQAKRIARLLSQPDRLLGVILLGNIFATAVGSSIVNELVGDTFGELGVLIAPLVYTVVVLIIAESTPKTLAALKPEATANFVSRPLQFMLWLLYPLVWATTMLSNALLKLFGVKMTKTLDPLNPEELRSVVNEASGLIPSRHQAMLLSILDLEKVRVEHIMIPRNEVIGIDLEDDPDTIMSQLSNSQHTLLPIYRADMDNVQGIFHTRNLAKVITYNGFEENTLIAEMEQPYFVPEGTSLHMQLLNFQKNKRRMALVVDEYGDVLGLVTLEDILEEIVGEFTTDVGDTEPAVIAEEDGTFLVDGGASVRDLNKTQQWELPTSGPTTLNGLIIEALEAIPTEGLCVLIEGYPVEVVEMKENTVKTARIGARLAQWHQQHHEAQD